jgi:tellurite resistance protein TerC
VVTESIGSPVLWTGFIAFVLLMLVLDLGVFHRKSHVIGFREALIWSGVWVLCSLTFNLGVYFWFGTDHAIEFLTGYLLEKSLSVDNIFVFIVIFSSLRTPLEYQHRVLFWGIVSALVLRAVMIFAGAALLQRFHWLIYLFGAFLVFTGVRLFFDRNKEEEPSTGRVVKALRKFVPSTDRLDGDRFFTVENGRRVATPLLTALMLVEVTDVLFAVDSIPAIFAITEDPFIVFTSNIFAILGLRSLFFLLAGVVDKFRYLKLGLAGVLVFVGIKMAAVDLYKLPPLISLGVITVILGSSIAASLVASRREARLQSTT